MKCYILKNPLMIKFSASFSFNPSVSNFSSCAPAILPIVASWISRASLESAEICGIAIICALFIKIASHSTCPKHSHVPVTLEWNSCFESSFATARDVIFVDAVVPKSLTSNTEDANCAF